MNKSVIRCFARSLAVGWIGVMAWANGGQAVQASEPEPAPQITVYVNNYAHIKPETLTRAKDVAARIFAKAGVKAVMVDSASSESAQVAGVKLYVNIYSRQMAERLGIPTNFGGVTPGTSNEQNRRLVYVLDDVAERMAHEEVMNRVNGKISRNADKGQILGHTMVHEIGHILLHQASHAPTGLMRANWDRNDLQNVATGDLLFTPGEAERVRAEVLRRNAKLTALEAVRSRQE